jgi:hypothetical protein
MPMVGGADADDQIEILERKRRTYHSIRGVANSESGNCPIRVGDLRFRASLRLNRANGGLDLWWNYGAGFRIQCG